MEFDTVDLCEGASHALDGASELLSRASKEVFDVTRHGDAAAEGDAGEATLCAIACAADLKGIHALLEISLKLVYEAREAADEAARLSMIDLKSMAEAGLDAAKTRSNEFNLL